MTDDNNDIRNLEDLPDEMDGLEITYEIEEDDLLLALGEAFRLVTTEAISEPLVVIGTDVTPSNGTGITTVTFTTPEIGNLRFAFAKADAIRSVTICADPDLS